jgi:hypothetical protein
VARPDTPQDVNDGETRVLREVAEAFDLREDVFADVVQAARLELRTRRRRLPLPDIERFLGRLVED